MSISPLLAKAQESSLKTDKNLPIFEIGDTVDVHVRILEGEKERVQIFTGIVIARRGSGTSETFTVRRIVDGEGVERVFPIHSPMIADVEIKRRAVVRRAKLYYLRNRIGKKAFTLKERPMIKKSTGRKRTRVKARKEKKVEVEATAVAEKPKKKKRTRKKKDAGDA